MKKKEIIKIISIVFLFLICTFISKFLVVLAIISIDSITPASKISGIKNYNKDYYLKEYGGDLDSNLSIFPNKTTNMVDATFKSSFKTNLFDSDGYIILSTKYNEDNFNKEIERLSDLKMTINYDNKKSYTNYIKYNTIFYEYPAFISIDGYGNTYEYALINQESLEIIYVYLSYPDINNSAYKKYLKKDNKQYLKNDTLGMYSMYNHTFDNGKSFIECNEC